MLLNRPGTSPQSSRCIGAALRGSVSAEATGKLLWTLRPHEASSFQPRKRGRLGAGVGGTLAHATELPRRARGPPGAVREGPSEGCPTPTGASKVASSRSRGTGQRRAREEAGGCVLSVLGAPQERALRSKAAHLWLSFIVFILEKYFKKEFLH